MSTGFLGAFKKVLKYLLLPNSNVYAVLLEQCEEETWKFTQIWASQWQTASFHQVSSSLEEHLNCNDTFSKTDRNVCGKKAAKRDGVVGFWEPDTEQMENIERYLKFQSEGLWCFVSLL